MQRLLSGLCVAARKEGGNGARDWPEKAEDWYVKTGRGRLIPPSGDHTFIEDAVWLCRTEAEVAL